MGSRKNIVASAWLRSSLQLPLADQRRGPEGMSVQEVVELVVDLPQVPRERVEAVVVPDREEGHVRDVEDRHRGDHQGGQVACAAAAGQRAPARRRRRGSAGAPPATEARRRHRRRAACAPVRRRWGRAVAPVGIGQKNAGATTAPSASKNADRVNDQLQRVGPRRPGPAAPATARSAPAGHRKRATRIIRARPPASAAADTTAPARASPPARPQRQAPAHVPTPAVTPECWR